jgi:hypothetical protein
MEKPEMRVLKLFGTEANLILSKIKELYFVLLQQFSLHLQSQAYLNSHICKPGKSGCNDKLIQDT